MLHGVLSTIYATRSAWSYVLLSINLGKHILAAICFLSSDTQVKWFIKQVNHISTDDTTEQNVYSDFLVYISLYFK